MEKYFVNYHQAVALKELGFDEKCFGYFDGNNNFRYTYNGEPKKFSDIRMGVSDSVLVGWVSAPLKTQVFDWFREKHNLASFIWYNSLCEKWRFDEIICFKTGDTLVDSDEQFQTYEEAESTAIDKLIELLK